MSAELIGAEAVAAPDGTFYGPRSYHVDKEILAELRRAQPWRPFLAALHAWFWIFVLVRGYLHFYDRVWFLYPLVVFFVAGRAGVFLQLAHEAAHGTIGPRRLNDWFGNWIACFPIGLDLRGYAEPHARHHACVNRSCDPVSDREKYRVCDPRKPALWLLLLKDLLGITAVTVRFLYDSPIANRAKQQVDELLDADEDYARYRPGARSRLDTIKKLSGIALVQLLIIAALFRFNLVHYVLFWGVPLTTAHMFLMRVRGIAEHGLGIQVGVTDFEDNRGTFYTRSFGTPVRGYRLPLVTWVERALIGSLNVYYHHEHHLFPKVPYYNLPKLHRLIAKQEAAQNPLIFARGYFDCLLFPLRRAP